MVAFLLLVDGSNHSAAIPPPSRGAVDKEFWVSLSGERAVNQLHAPGAEGAGNKGRPLHEWGGIPAGTGLLL